MAGEAVKRLSHQFRETHPDFNWAGVAGLRDLLVHAYERVDQVELWNIATNSVPPLFQFTAPFVPPEQLGE